MFPGLQCNTYSLFDVAIATYIMYINNDLVQIKHKEAIIT